MMDYIVTTPCGQLQGTAGRIPGTAAYKGIRYATAGRWEYPRQVEHWQGVYDATQYGSCSYQPRSFYNEEENLKKREELWEYLQLSNPRMYKKLRYGLFGRVMTAKTPVGRKFAELCYKISQKIYGFN